MIDYVGGVYWVRLFLQRGLAAIYLVAFLSALAQFRPLLGERGLLPVRRFLRSTSFLETPSLFHLHYGDGFFSGVALVGVALSAAALLGLPERGPLSLSIAVWLVLWALYLSIVNVGQTFYGFGWESMLVEAGFFASFLGPSWMAPSVVPVLLLRWMLFRVELGAGLIKLRHDRCWRDLTCLYYHYETQPLPNPFSWYFHRIPKPMHRFSVLFSHFVQVVVPFGFFAPQPIASVAGALAMLQQLLLVVSGNYAWLNWLTIVLGASTLSDAALSPIFGAPGALAARPGIYEGLLVGLAGITLVLSVEPVKNFFSEHQAMNRSYNPIHLVGSYGAFGSVTRERYEVVLEGTLAPEIGQDTVWREYEQRAKPGPIGRRPPQIAPYHLRLDWLLWFLPFSTFAAEGRVVTVGYDVWFVRLVARLLEADRATLRLFRRDPWDGKAPRFVRARYYRYEFTSAEEHRRTGAWWKRTLVGDYLPALSLPDARAVLAEVDAATEEPVRASKRKRRVAQNGHA